MIEADILSHQRIQEIRESASVAALAGKVRYDMFLHPDTTTEQWLTWLDCDFDNREHLFKTAALGRAICQLEGVDTETTRDVVLTGAVHDAVESRLGDKNYHLKTASDDQEEIDIMLALVEGGELPLSQEECTTVQAIMADKNRKPPVTDRGVFFDLSEIDGYVLSAFTAQQTAHEQHADMTSSQRHLLRMLSANVLASQLHTVVEYANDGRASQDFFLLANKYKIGYIIDNVDDELIDRHATHCADKGVKPERVASLTDRLLGLPDLWTGYQAAYTSRIAA